MCPQLIMLKQLQRVVAQLIVVQVVHDAVRLIMIMATVMIIVMLVGGTRIVCINH
jgi:hypothetical protein